MAFNWTQEAERLRRMAQQFDSMHTRLINSAGTLAQSDECCLGWDTTLEQYRVKLLELAWEMENRIDYRKAHERTWNLPSEIHARTTRDRTS